MKKTAQQNGLVEASESELRVELSNLSLEARQGDTSSSEIADASVCTISFRLAAPDAELPARLASYLSSHPLELADLLQDGQPSGAAALLPPHPPWAAQGAGGVPAGTCSCGAAGCAHTAAAAELAAARWKAAPSLRLAALGLPPQRLRDAVFAAWAAEAPEGGAELPAEARRGLAGSRGEQQGPALAEWLGEAAEQDRMHTPGPQFHDVNVNLTSGEVPAAPAEEAQAWAELLPGIPGAAEATERIRAQTSARVRQQAAALREAPRPSST